MREIKFRAWLPDVNVLTTLNSEEIDLMIEEGNPVMQFTGLKDKNGVEIYEGDLLRIPAKDKYEEYTFNCFEVFYHDNDCIGGQNIGFCINRMHPQGHSGGGMGYKFTPQSMLNFEVIGNIHENPELLEK